jgi:hypothetical protein
MAGFGARPKAESVVDQRSVHCLTPLMRKSSGNPIIQPSAAVLIYGQTGNECCVQGRIQGYMYNIQSEQDYQQRIIPPSPERPSSPPVRSALLSRWGPSSMSLLESYAASLSASQGMQFCSSMLQTYLFNAALLRHWHARFVRHMRHMSCVLCHYFHVESPAMVSMADSLWPTAMLASCSTDV